MPHSSHEGISAAMSHIVRLQPKTVLDIGAGYGKWGYLIREALDFMDGREAKEDFTVCIDGVDAHPVQSPLHDWVYTSFRRMNVTAELDDLPPYDLVVLGDVIEHLDKQIGLELLEHLTARCKNVLVLTPSYFFDQEVPGRPYERHRSAWTRDDFRRWDYDFQIQGGTIVAVIAGAAGTWPDGRTRSANEAAYSLPFLNRGSVRPATVKRLYARSVGLVRRPRS